MEIVKPGRPPAPRNNRLIGTCDNCGCMVRCLTDDKAILPYSRSNPVFRVKCPTERCGSEITLGTDIYPPDAVFRGSSAA